MIPFFKLLLALLAFHSAGDAGPGYKAQEQRIALIEEYMEAHHVERILYIGQDRTVNIGLKKETPDLGLHREHIRELYRDDSSIRFFEAAYSEADLDRFHEEIREFSTSAYPSEVAGISSNVFNQQIDIYLKDPDSEVKQALKDRFPDAPMNFLQSTGGWDD
jgi:hypothetical protein